MQRPILTVSYHRPPCFRIRFVKALVDLGRERIQKTDVIFALGLMRDAEALHWDPNELAKRKRVIRDVLIGDNGVRLKTQLGGAVSALYDSGDYNGDNQDGDYAGELFRKKGWNAVDSGFQLWGGGVRENDESEKPDPFLQSRGWNDVDSGFRWI